MTQACSRCCELTDEALAYAALYVGRVVTVGRLTLMPDGALDPTAAMARFTPTERTILVRLLRAFPHAAAYTGLGAAIWPTWHPEEWHHLLGVNAARMRPKLAEYGVSISAVDGYGYRLVEV